MTSNDRTDHATDRLATALLERAERGEVRGATDVFAAARAVPTGGDLVLLTDHRARTRRAVAVAAAVTSVLAVGGAIALRDDAAPTGADDPYCSALTAPGLDPSPVDGDVVAYLPPGATSAELDALAAELRARSGVASARTIGRDETYAQFRSLFADEPVLLDTVEATQLPTSVAVDLADDDPATAAALADELEARPDLWTARTGMTSITVLDLLVWPGIDPYTFADGGNPDLGIRRYGAGWAGRAEAVRTSAPPEVADDIDHLLERLDGDPAVLVDEGATGPSFIAARDAAERLRADARDRCALEVSPQLADREAATIEHTTATTEATADD